MKDNGKSKFGFDEIPSKEKQEKVSAVFSSVSQKYDIMNDIMSFGLHRLWKDRFCQKAKLRDDDDVLDVACGTGDIALNIARMKSNIKITCLDENNDMLTICKNRLIDKGFIKNITFLKTQVEHLNSENQFSLATIAFGFRNFTNPQEALRNLYKSLKPSGRLLIMDFKTPSDESIKKIYEKYTDYIIPKIGKLVSNDSASYQYLSDSIKTYLKPNELEDLMKKNNFIKVDHESLPGDIVTIHVGYKA